jgi:hypothetical protein
LQEEFAMLSVIGSMVGIAWIKGERVSMFPYVITLSYHFYSKYIAEQQEGGHPL